MNMPDKTKGLADSANADGKSVSQPSNESKRLEPPPSGAKTPAVSKGLGGQQGGVKGTPARAETRVQPLTTDVPVSWAIETLQIEFKESIKKRRKSFLIRFGLFVGLPTLLAAIYVFLYATPRYVSEFQIVYQSNSQAQATAAGGGILSSMLGMSSGGLDMSRVLGSYIASDTLLRNVDKKLNLRAHYSDRRIDWLDRLPTDASNEDFLNYFANRVKVDVIQGGYIVVDVEAFDPLYAAKLAKAMADDSDRMVEALTERSRHDEMSFAQQELDRSERRLLAAELDVTKFRMAHHHFDPQAGAEQLETSVIGGLETQLSQLRSQLANSRTFMGADSPTAKALTSQIAALEKQILEERTRFARSGPASASSTAELRTDSYSDLVGDYTTLTTNQQFAQDAYVSAKQTYDLARADALRKENYVESFVEPNLPQRSTSPNPWLTILATFCVALIAYGAGSLLVSSFSDQAGL